MAKAKKKVPSVKQEIESQTKAPVCKNCQFFLTGNRHTQVGLCRRFPPSIHAARREVGEADDQPRVHNGDWCGEHKPRES